MKTLIIVPNHAKIAPKRIAMKPFVSPFAKISLKKSQNCVKKFARTAKLVTQK